MKLLKPVAIVALCAGLAQPLSHYMNRVSRKWVEIRNAKQQPTQVEAERNLARRPVSPAEARAALHSLRVDTCRVERGKRLHRIGFPDGSSVEFTDRRRRGCEPARRSRVVVFTGDQPAATASQTLFADAAARTGSPLEAAEALRFVSQHEGGFDAINTWDRARFSWGFIQFAGGRGFPKVLARFKSQAPELFHRHLGQYGVDVIPGSDGEPKPVCVIPRRNNIVSGRAAEQAFGDSPVLVGLFIRAGRDPEVQRLQIESAFEQYVQPALRAEWSGVVLSSVLRSPKGMAMLIDRKIHDGNNIRIARVVERVQRANYFDPARAESHALLAAVRDALGRAGSSSGRRLQSIYYSDLPGPGWVGG
jgi:hypothetical protein